MRDGFVARIGELEFEASPDGDNVRMGLNASPALLKERHGEEFAKRFGLGFSAQDREENIRRIGAVADQDWIFAKAAQGLYPALSDRRDNQ